MCLIEIWAFGVGQTRGNYFVLWILDIILLNLIRILVFSNEWLRNGQNNLKKFKIYYNIDTIGSFVFVLDTRSLSDHALFAPENFDRLKRSKLLMARIEQIINNRVVVVLIQTQTINSRVVNTMHNTTE